MPGTIHVSVLELVGLPSPPQSSTMGVKVSMGKQAHEMQDNNKETSFALASLRDKLNVSIRDSEGSEIAHTDVETRSIVEKGTWDDLFPLKDGGHIRMRLHFILTENELNRIRSMRESAARKKQVDLQKRSHSSSDLAVASGGSPASSQDSLKSQHQTWESSVEPSDGQAKIIFTDSNDEDLNKAQPGQKKQAFSTSKSTGALDKFPAYQQLKERIQGQNVEQQSRLNKKLTNVRKLMLAIESSPVKATTQFSSSTIVDIPSKEPNLKKMVAVNSEPVLCKIYSAPASVAQEEIGGERGESLPDTNKTKTMVQSSSDTTLYIPAKVTKLKKVVINTEPVVSNLESAPAFSTREKVGEVRRESLLVTDETKELGRSRSKTRVDNPFKVPILKKAVFDNTKPVLSKFLTASATSTTGDIEKERGKLLPVTDKTKETDLSSRNTTVDTPPKEPILKKTVAVNSEAAPSLSTPEEIGKEKLFPYKNKTKETGQLSSNTRVYTPMKMPILKKVVDVSSETDMSNSESASASSSSEKMGKGREKYKYYGSTQQEISDEYSISKTQPTNEKSEEEKKAMKKLHASPISEKSIFSLNTLLEALPRRKQSSTDLFNPKYGYTTNDALVIDKKWRSKQWKSSQCRATSKVFDGNEHCSIDSLRGWIFLDEMIRSCVLRDESPLLNVTEGCLSNCSQDNDQEKLTDTGLTQRKSEKRSTGSKNLESNSWSDNISYTGPGGQVMKIAIMAGFGLLVFLTRQGK